MTTNIPIHHTCHAVGCERRVPPRMFMCRPHWSRLPQENRKAIWATYNRGQERRKDPSLAYRIAAENARLALAILDKRSPDELDRVRKNLEWLESKVNHA